MSLIRAEKRFTKPAARRAVEPDALHALYEADLKRSGIEPKEGKSAGLRLQDSRDDLFDRLNPRRKGDRPETFTAQGYTIEFSQSNGDSFNFIRARKLIGEFNTEDTKRGFNYTQPANSLPHIYLPKMGVRAEALQTVGEDGRIKIIGELVITEGEKKAIVANLCGIPCIALGGVWNFRSAKHYQMLLREFDWFDLSECDLVFCFDCDVFGNADVSDALYQCKHAIRQHARPRSIQEIRLSFEQIKDKVALDDWLGKFDDRKSAFFAFQSLERETDVQQELWSILNQEVCFVENVKRYFDIRQREPFPSEKSLIEQYGPDGSVMDPYGGKKPVTVASLWLAQRDTAITNVNATVYAPGRPAKFMDRATDKRVTLNEWRPGDLAPIPYKGTKDDKKDLALFIEYWGHLTASLTDDERKWLLQWIAYPLKNPGAKLQSAVCAYSKKKRTGKTTISWILKRCYGKHNSAMVRGDTLNGIYTNYLMAQFVYVEEIHTAAFGKRGTVMQTLKTQITDDTFELNRKYLPVTTAPSHFNYYMTTNHEDALRLEDDDARFFVLHAPESRWPKEQFNALYAWLKGEHGDMYGCARVYGYLLSVDTEDFDSTGTPPRTNAWRAMYRSGIAGRDDTLHDIVERLISNPVEILGIVGKSKITKPDCELYDPFTLVRALNKYAKENAMEFKGRLTEQRIGQLIGRRVPKMTLRSGGNLDATLYAMFNRKDWRKAKKRAWREYWKDNLKT